MDDLLQFVPEDKQEEFKQAASSYIKAEPETLMEAVKGNQSVFDKIVEGPLKKREENLREKEFPKLLEEEREKLRKELNPEEEPWQKELREMREKLTAKEQKEQFLERQNSLREQYKDVPELAARLAKLGDEEISPILEQFTKLSEEKAELEKKLKFGAGAPPAGSEVAGDEAQLMKQYNDLLKQGKGEAAMRVYGEIRELRKQRAS